MYLRLSTQSLAIATILATLSSTEASMPNIQPKFILKAEENKAFDNSSLLKTFDMKSENIAECLEHCLQDCRCESFQICQNKKCQLCSSHKKENSSLLHDSNSCVYATYEMRQSTNTFQKLEKQCSDMSCSMKFNCCQLPDLCPKNKICKPFNSPTEPWKRFTCKCRVGYYGENCDKPIRSCAGYLNMGQKSGKYKMRDSENSEYDVYCHFNSDAVWTLVQSYSFANRSLEQFKKALFKDSPISENNPTWSGYRLNKPRMRSIKDNSTFLRFTCDYEKINFSPKTSDFLTIPFRSIVQNSKSVDVLEFNGGTSVFSITKGHGNIGGNDLNQCQIWLFQRGRGSIHHFRFQAVFRNIKIESNPACKLNLYSATTKGRGFFGDYNYLSDEGKKFHQCVRSDNSTTQLWFGMLKPQVHPAILTSSAAWISGSDRSHIYRTK